ncbi:LytR/AlgR family response regulator transcription factor [Rudanella paleaurantiibacter]|nr:LytTR family DNA-binding domain-containing protein [Rudanella paleaurantiibacter]
MNSQFTTLPLAFNELEAVARQLQMAELTLPFWGYRKPMPIHRIVRLEGEGNYTHFYFNDGTKLIVSLTLKRIESRLPANVFARSHKKNLINLLYLREIRPKRHPYMVGLSNGDYVEVSRRKAAQFYQQVETFQQEMNLLRNIAVA